VGALAAGVERATAVALNLIEEGLADRLLLSTGLSRVAQVRKYDGPGYAHLFREVLPRLREAGIDDGTLRTVTHDNPLRWLTSGTA
jgi:phosphotriesterase-related protein